MKLQGDRKLFLGWAIAVVCLIFLTGIPLVYFSRDILMISMGFIIACAMVMTLMILYPYRGHFWIVTETEVECYKWGRLKKKIAFSDIAAFLGGKYGITQFSIYEHKANRMPSRWDTMTFIVSQDFDKLFIPWAKWKSQQENAEQNAAEQPATRL